MAGRQLIVEILGDSKPFEKSLDAAGGKASGFSNVIKGVGMGIGAGVFSLATGAVDMFVNSLGDAQKAYQEDQASQAKMGVALKNNIPNWNGNTTAIENVIAAQMRLGFSDEEQRDSLAKLAGVTNDVAASQQIQAVAMDLARAKGIDLATATDIMIKAHNGNYKGLKDIGVAMNENATFTDALAQVTAIAGGQAEAYAETSLGKQEAAQLRVGESMEKIGGIVDQVASAVLPVLADAFVVVVDVLGEVWAAIQPVIETIAKELQPVFKALLPVAQKIFGGIMTVVKALAPVFGEVFGLIAKGLGAWFTFLAGIFDKISGIISGAIKVFQGLGTAVGKVWNSIAEGVKGAINAVIRAINGIIRAINKIQVHINLDLPDPLPDIRFNWNGLNLGQLPYLHQGGLVPGTSGEDVLAVLQAGERVIPRNEARSAGITIIIEGDVYGDSIDRLSTKIAQRLRLAGG